LPNDHTGSHEDNETSDEADATLRNLRDGLTVRENEDGDSEQELNRLKNIDSVTCPSAVDSEEAVCVTLHGIFV
jgi:hypothetical protein